MKLFPRLTFLVLAMLLVAVVAVSLSFYVSEGHSIREEAKIVQNNVLQNLTHIARESYLSNDDLLLVKYTRALQAWNPALVNASVLSDKGTYLSHSEPQRIGQSGVSDAPSQSSLLALSQPVTAGNKRLGTATVTFSQKRLEEDLALKLHQLQKRVISTTLWVLLLAFGASFVMARSLTRPIEQLSRVAGQIGKGKWTIETESLEERSDEIGGLSRTMVLMAEQLKELDHMKEDFVSAVTHELRSPLSAIQSYLNTIIHDRSVGRETDMDDFLKRMGKNTERLTHFVNDLLDVAALERGKLKLDLQVFHVRHLAEEVAILFEPKFMEKELTCKLDQSQKLPMVSGDMEKIRQVLVNLVSNAIKFTPPRGLIELKFEVTPDARQLKVTVSDSGVGIAPKDMDKIFEKFEQVKSARKSVHGPKGTGLGLSISRALVELHGGVLGVESQVGRGSHFFFTLPVARVAAAVTH